MFLAAISPLLSPKKTVVRLEVSPSSSRTVHVNLWNGPLLLGMSSNNRGWIILKVAVRFIAVSGRNNFSRVRMPEPSMPRLLDVLNTPALSGQKGKMAAAHGSLLTTSQHTHSDSTKSDCVTIICLRPRIRLHRMRLQHVSGSQKNRAKFCCRLPKASVCGV